MSVRDIPVGLQASKIHFLHASYFPPLKEGDAVGRYIIRYSNGGREEASLRYGRELRSNRVWKKTGEPLEKPSEATIRWSSRKPLKHGGENCHAIYHDTWRNPRPDVRIEKIDFIATKENGAVALFAMTAE